MLFLFLLALPCVLAEQTDLLFFYGKGCPHCARGEVFLEQMQEKYPELNVIEYETYSNRDNSLFFSLIADAFDHSIQGVPTTFIDEKIIVGFSDSLAQHIETEIQRCISQGCASPLSKLEIQDHKESIEIIGESSPTDDPKKTELKQSITIPAVLGAAAVDAINPCAFAVLIILMTTILAAGSKRKALLAGLAFTASIFISYFLMGLGLYSAIQAARFAHTFYFIVAVLAIAIGLFNLKDYFNYGRWFVMEVPMKWRPRLKSLIRGISSIPGAFLIGFAVSLFLLPCTSGPYIVILGLLAHTTTQKAAIGLLLFYNLIFILPMLIITALVYFGFTTTEKAEEWRQSKLEVLHLIAGIILVLLGIGMFIAIGYGWV